MERTESRAPRPTRDPPAGSWLSVSGALGTAGHRGGPAGLGGRRPGELRGAGPGGATHANPASSTRAVGCRLLSAGDRRGALRLSGADTRTSQPGRPRFPATSARAHRHGHALCDALGAPPPSAGGPASLKRRGWPTGHSPANPSATRASRPRLPALGGRTRWASWDRAWGVWAELCRGAQGWRQIRCLARARRGACRVCPAAAKRRARRRGVRSEGKARGAAGALLREALQAPRDEGK